MRQERALRAQPRFAGDTIFGPVTDQTEVTQCWYASALYLYSLLLGLVSGVPWRQPHRRLGLATLPSVGAIP